MARLIITFAAASGLLSVVLGAFASHGLRDALAPRLLSAFETGVAYQMTHSLALIGLALVINRWGRTRLFDIAAGGFMLGIVLFSGSLYLLALTEITWVGPVTPVGGLAFIAGWVSFAVGAWKHVER